MAWCSQTTNHYIPDLVDLTLNVFQKSVEAVRGFTQLKLVKIDSRNSLKGIADNQLLAVCLVTADVDVGSYDTTSRVIAFKKWWRIHRFEGFSWKIL